MFGRRRQHPEFNTDFELGSFEDDSHHWELWHEHGDDPEWEGHLVKIKRMRERGEHGGHGNVQRRRDKWRKGDRRQRVSEALSED